MENPFKYGVLVEDAFFTDRNQAAFGGAESFDHDQSASLRKVQSDRQGFTGTETAGGGAESSDGRVGGKTGGDDS